MIFCGKVKNKIIDMVSIRGKKLFIAFGVEIKCES